MTNNIIINRAKKAIEISKQFSKEASIYGSDAYKDLKDVQKDFPKFRVCIKSTPKRSWKDRLTLKDILYYVAKHSGRDSQEWKELEDLRGKSIEELKEELGEGYIFETQEAASFFQIKKWFFKTYPELADKTEKRQARIEEIISEAA